MTRARKGPPARGARSPAASKRGSSAARTARKPKTAPKDKGKARAGDDAATRGDRSKRLLDLVMILLRARSPVTYRDIRDLMDDRPHRIRVRTDRPRELAAGLVAQPGVLGVRLEPGLAGRAPAVIVDTTDAPTFRRTLAGLARDREAQLLEVAPLDDDLESVFRYLVQP